MESANASRFVSRLTRDTLALILAGGSGTRLRGLTRWDSKPAVAFGGKFRIIDFPLSNCINSGIRRIGVLTQYKAHTLIRHLQQGWSFLRAELGEFVEILPAQQRIQASWYAGTADAVYQNLDIIRLHAPEYVLILGGDHIYKMDYGTMLATHAESGADLTIACLEVPASEARQFGVMTVDQDNRVVRFAEKPAQPETIPGSPDQALVSMGVYAFNTKFLFEQLIRDADAARSSHDFGKDVIPSVIDRYRVLAYPFRGPQGAPAYWRDVGTVDAYWSANMELIGVTPELNLYDTQWPIWTYQEQLPPAKFVFDDDGRRGVAIDSMVSGGCIISGATVRRSLLFSNVRVESYASVEDSVILPNASVGRRCRLRKVVVGANTVLPDGTVIGEDPALDAERYDVSSSGVVQVSPEMLGQEIQYVR